MDGWGGKLHLSILILAGQFIDRHRLLRMWNIFFPTVELYIDPNEPVISVYICRLMTYVCHKKCFIYSPQTFLSSIYVLVIHFHVHAVHCNKKPFQTRFNQWAWHGGANKRKLFNFITKTRKTKPKLFTLFINEKMWD